jgi:hypothetical protein
MSSVIMNLVTITVTYCQSIFSFIEMLSAISHFPILPTVHCLIFFNRIIYLPGDQGNISSSCLSNLINGGAGGIDNASSSIVGGSTGYNPDNGTSSNSSESQSTETPWGTFILGSGKRSWEGAKAACPGNRIS